MRDGYIKLWRKSLDSAVWQNPKLWRFWSYCLMKATYKKHTALVGFQDVALEPGQFIFTRRNCKSDTGLSEQEIRTCLVAAQKLEILTINSTNKYSVISILNWETYQQPENEINQQINQLATSKQPASNPSTRKERINTEKKKYKIDFNFDLSRWENISQPDLEVWQKAYPAVDLDLQLSQAAAWLAANPSKKKSDYKRFLNGWFKRCQDRGGDVRSNQPQQQIQPRTYAQAQDAERRQRAIRVLQRLENEHADTSGNPRRVGNAGDCLPPGESE